MDINSNDNVFSTNKDMIVSEITIKSQVVVMQILNQGSVQQLIRLQGGQNYGLVMSHLQLHYLILEEYFFQKEITLHYTELAERRTCYLMVLFQHLKKLQQILISMMTWKVILLNPALIQFLHFTKDSGIVSGNLFVLAI